MNLTELKAEIDGLKKTIVETIKTEIAEDRIKTAASARAEARHEINDMLTGLEKVDLLPENAQAIGRTIAAIEWLRSNNDKYSKSVDPVRTEEITKIAETRKITLAEAEILIFAVRASEMVKRLEAMKPHVLAAIMDGAP
jgi:hypothetical protein